VADQVVRRAIGGLIGIGAGFLLGVFSNSLTNQLPPGPQRLVAVAGWCFMAGVLLLMIALALHLAGLLQGVVAPILGVDRVLGRIHPFYLGILSAYFPGLFANAVTNQLSPSRQYLLATLGAGLAALVAVLALVQAAGLDRRLHAAHAVVSSILGAVAVAAEALVGVAIGGLLLKLTTGSWDMAWIGALVSGIAFLAGPAFGLARPAPTILGSPTGNSWPSRPGWPREPREL